MAKFSYTAEKAGGEVYSGVAEAADRFELYQIIRREGGHLLNFADEAAGGALSLAYWNATFSRISQQQKIMFARNLGSMLQAGLSLSRALAVIERQAANLRLKQVAGEIAGEVRRGASLHDALGKFPAVFPPLLAAMVRAGEEGGTLASTLKLAADQMERAHSLKKKIRSAMIYPCIVLAAIFAIGVLMMLYVVPTLAGVFAQMNAQLPLSTEVIIGISNALSQHTLPVLGGVALVFLLLFAGLRTARGKRALDVTLLALPAIGTIAREVNAARTARSLASLIASGVDVLSALDITRDIVQNGEFKKILEEAKAAVAQGNTLSSVFLRHERLYPAFVGEMVAVGEETGETPQMLANLAEYYEAEVDRKTKDLSTVIEPVLMLLIGAAVGFFAISMISPIYSIEQHIS